MQCIYLQVYIYRCNQLNACAKLMIAINPRASGGLSHTPVRPRCLARSRGPCSGIEPALHVQPDSGRPPWRRPAVQAASLHFRPFRKLPHYTFPQDNVRRWGGRARTPSIAMQRRPPWMWHQSDENRSTDCMHGRQTETASGEDGYTAVAIGMAISARCQCMQADKRSPALLMDLLDWAETRQPPHGRRAGSPIVACRCRAPQRRWATQTLPPAAG